MTPLLSYRHSHAQHERRHRPLWLRPAIYSSRSFTLTRGKHLPLHLMSPFLVGHFIGNRYPVFAVSPGLELGSRRARLYAIAEHRMPVGRKQHPCRDALPFILRCIGDRPHQISADGVAFLREIDFPVLLGEHVVAYLLPFEAFQRDVRDLGAACRTWHPASCVARTVRTIRFPSLKKRRR